MAIIKGDKSTGDLLSWTPPEPKQSFSEEQVRAVTFSGRFAKAISLALKDSPYSREEIAERMTDFLGTQISKSMLDAYASEARAEHNMSMHRYAALVHATQDWRLLSALVDIFPCAVVDIKYLDVIKLAQTAEKRRELEQAEAALRFSAKSGGLL